MRKRVIMFVVGIIFILIIIFLNKSSTTQATTKLLYQDITINEDGSITVKEATWLNGEYNGRLREIEYKNLNATEFSGTYSNFSGNCDIYNGSGINEIKIYDISQENFTSIEDITNSEKIYEEVEKASNGKYGVFTKDYKEAGIDFRIFCPANKKKVICMEYTIADVVVVHNDVAELYWNVIGENYREDIEEFKVLIHLPNEDNDVRIWTHGPLTGFNKIVDSKTLLFEDSNLNSYTAETVRLMFNKQLVPLATKKTNIDGRENILKYEATKADEANVQREQEKLDIENLASAAVIEFEKYPNTVYLGEKALEYVNQLDNNNEQKKSYLDRIEKSLEKQAESKISKLEKNASIESYNSAIETLNMLSNDNQKKEIFLKRLESCKDEANEQWKEEIEYKLQLLIEDNYRRLEQSKIDIIKQEINEGFDEESKDKYILIVSELEQKLEKSLNRVRNAWLGVILISYSILVGIVLLKIIKEIIERKRYNQKYYREFPSEDNPYVIEYLTKGRITSLSFSATILSLITKNVIKIEKNSKDNKDLKFILSKHKVILTGAEKVLLKILFVKVGKNNECSINALKKYIKIRKNATELTIQIKKFNEYSAEEAEDKYFIQSPKNKREKKLILIFLHFFIMIFVLVFGVNNNELSLDFNDVSALLSMTIVSSISAIIIKRDKKRTLEGQLIYSKWLAHKRFLKHFSNFDEKDLPEIVLWDKYMVTATILGCADKVNEKMKLHIYEYSEYDKMLKDIILKNELTITLNSEIKSVINTANNRGYSSNASSEGFGGGSSGGGGRRWTEEAAEVVSKVKKLTRMLVFLL